MGDSSKGGIGIGTILFWIFLFYMFFGGDDEEKKVEISAGHQDMQVTQTEESFAEKIEHSVKKAEQKINEGFTKLEEGLENSGAKLEQGVKKLEAGIKKFDNKITGGVDDKEPKTEERGMTEKSSKPQEAEDKEEESITKDERTAGELEKL